ncbi:transketolase [Desulfobacterales bacterium HSG16]|nr:transketolase [Desulfobacterales bacterium HSG16]
MSKSLPDSRPEIDGLSVTTIRTLSMDGVQAANSGHPGAPMGLAPAAYVLWTRVMKHNPENLTWVNRDRFVLSGGHASMLLYSMMHLSGYGLSLDDLKNFRQWGSKTPGHPEYRETPGVETTTGPLGQGFANAVGMAMAERHLAARFNKSDADDMIDHNTWVMCGDGDLMEGLSSEAASLAGHLGLGKLNVIYDDNDISIEGSTDIAFTEDVRKKFEAFGWQVLIVEDGNDLNAIYDALVNAKEESQKPSIIMLKTQIAYGSPNKQGSADAHGAPLGEDEIRLTKKFYNWPEDKSFYVPDQAREPFAKNLENGKKAESAWNKSFEIYKDKYPEPAKLLANALSLELKEGWDADIPDFSDQTNPVATRAASGQVLNAIAANVPELLGGSADLAPSNKTYINKSGEFQKGKYDQRNIRFGVREHAMGSILNGMALHGGILPYGGTFLVFADYMRSPIRLAALMKLPVIYVFTHDSIAVGEDGPTHQPVEHLASLRIIPDLTVIRPADATETAEAWRMAVSQMAESDTNGPVALILSRQKLPIYDRKDKYGPVSGLRKGAYVLDDCEKTADIILIATGSEVSLAVAAKEQLAEKNISARVVSAPSWELFDKTSAEYKESVLPADVKVRLGIEAGVSFGWHRYVGDSGDVIGIDRFGASAPGNVNLEKFGFSVDNVVQKALEMLK